MKDLEGRVAVVAGATRGAGRSTTNFFSENGVPVGAVLLAAVGTAGVLACAEPLRVRSDPDSLSPRSVC